LLFLKRKSHSYYINDILSTNKKKNERCEQHKRSLIALFKIRIRTTKI